MSSQKPAASIYARLMPLMYGLIGAASMLFLNTLFCGSPFAWRSTECRPASVQTAAGAAARPGPDAGRASAADARVAHQGTQRASADHAADSGPLQRSAAAGASAAAADATAPSSAADPPAAAPASQPTIAALTAAIKPCVGVRARSFRLGVRLQLDGRVRRVFVARDPGVSAAMAACIQREIGALSLDALAGAGYAEWRVRQVDAKLSLTLTRPEALAR